MIVLPFQTLFTPDIPPSTEWKNAGWEVQPPQPPSKPKPGAGAMIATGLTLVLTDPSIVRVPVFDAWEVQPVQPPHPTPEKRAAATMRGDDGIQAAFINWKNAGSEIQPFQPPAYPTVRQRYAGTKGRSQFAIIQDPVPMAWGVPEQLRAVRLFKAGAILQNNDGFWSVAAAVPTTFPWGFEPQVGQPPHPRPERIAVTLLGDSGTQFVFSNWKNFGWEIQILQPPHLRIEKAGAVLRGDDGAEARLINWFNFGWDVQSFQPSHPRSERSGALAFGDLGTEAVFISVVVTAPAWGWEIQNVQPPAYPSSRQRYAGTKGRSQFALFANPQPMEWFVPFNIKHPKTEKAASIAFGDTGTEAPFIPTAVVTAAVWGWDNQPVQPRTYPTLAQRGIGAAGESTFVSFQLDPFTEVQAFQPPRPRVERRGAIFPPANIDSVFVQTVVPFTSPGGFEFQPLTSRFVFKGGVIAKGDDGTQGPFVNWRNAGAEIQPWQPPHRAPERKAAAFFRGDDGNQAAFINWLVDGWAIQPPQPPHPRPERSAAGLLGDTGIEAPYVFVAPPPLSPWGYEVQSHVFFKRPVGSALAGAININAVYVFIPPPPPPPPSPIPVQFRSKVFAVNCAQGNTNVAVSSETNVFNPVTVGMSITLVVSSGNSLPPNTPGQTLVITKPDSTVIRLTYPDAFIGTLDTMTDVGLFLGGTYLVGGIYLDQVGFWSVQVVKSPVATGLGPFFVSPA